MLASGKPFAFHTSNVSISAARNMKEIYPSQFPSSFIRVAPESERSIASGYFLVSTSLLIRSSSGCDHRVSVVCSRAQRYDEPPSKRTVHAQPNSFTVFKIELFTVEWTSLHHVNSFLSVNLLR